MLKQRTLKNTIRATGVGLHTGQKVYMTLRPAAGEYRHRLPPHRSRRAGRDSRARRERRRDDARHDADQGRRQGLDRRAPDVGVRRASASTTPSSTCPRPKCRSWTAARARSCSCCSPPASRSRTPPKRFIRIRSGVKVEDGDKWARFEPYDGFKVSFAIEFDHPVFKRRSQVASIDFSTTTFLREVSRARTFGFMRDIEYMRARNLALGGNMDNAIVLDEFRVLNEDGLRYEDEFVKHKILDAIGDLYLLGHSLIGEFNGYKSGHALNNRLLRTLIADRSAWEEVTFETLSDAPISYVPAVATV